MKLYDLLKTGVNHAEDIFFEKKPIYKSGIKLLDDNIFLAPGSTNYICARPGQGKTYFIHTLLTSMIQRYKVAYMCGEDSEENIGLSLISHITGGRFSSRELYTQKMTTDHFVKIKEEILALKDKPHINNCAFISTCSWDVKKVIEELKRLEARGCQIAIYDYMQLIKTSTEDTFMRHTEISESITEYIRKSSMAFIGCLQLNRGGDKSGNPHALPTLADLYGSSSYEKDAYSIVILQRVVKTEKGGDGSVVPTATIETDNYYLLIRKNRLGGVSKGFVVDRNYKLIQSL